MAQKTFAAEKGFTILDGNNSADFRIYAGNPEGQIIAGVGSICLDTANGDTYKKKSGTGDSGWELLSGSSAIDAFDWKASVLAATTVTDGNINLAAFTGTIDGETLVDGGRYLIKDQTAGEENGIYTYTSGTTSFTRSTDADDSAKVSAGMAIPVTTGAENDNSIWILTTNDPIVLDTTPLTFTSFGVYVEGNGIQISNGTISVRLSATGGLEFNGTDVSINTDSTTNSTLVNSSNELTVNGYAKITGTTATGTNDVLDSVSITETTAVEWLVTVKNGTTGRYTTKIIAVNLGTGTTVDNNDYGIIKVGTFTTKPKFDVDVNSGSMRLLFNGDAGLSYSVTRITNV